MMSEFGHSLAACLNLDTCCPNEDNFFHLGVSSNRKEFLRASFFKLASFCLNNKIEVAAAVNSPPDTVVPPLGVSKGPRA